jgi:predicted nucleotidyltransferase
MLTETEIAKIKSLVSRKEGIAYAILFGSALKRLLPQSDIDLIIGGELSLLEKADLSMELSIDLRRPVDIISPKEANCDVVLRAFSFGIPLVIRDKKKLKEDYLNHYRLCDQEHPLKKVRFERLRRVYGNG